MANAGRVVIIPKGEYSSTKFYEQLDMVLHKSESWVCKKAVTGKEPSDKNSEYWYRSTNVKEMLSAEITPIKTSHATEVSERKSADATEKAARETADAVLQARMDSFTTLKAGSTTGDAELIDGHVDYTGKTWDNIGDHIRGVSVQISSEIEVCENYDTIDNSKWEKFGLSSGVSTNTSCIHMTDYIDKNVDFIKVPTDARARIGLYTDSDNLFGYGTINGTDYFTGMLNFKEFYATSTYKNMKLEVSKNGAELDTTYGENVKFLIKKDCVVISPYFIPIIESNRNYIMLGGTYKSVITVSGLSNVNIQIIGNVTFSGTGGEGFHVTSSSKVKIYGGKIRGGCITIVNTPYCIVKDIEIYNIGDDSSSAIGGLSLIGGNKNFLIDNVNVHDITAGTQTDDGFAHAWGIGIMSQEQDDGTHTYSENGTISNCIIHNINYTKAKESVYDGDGIYIIQRPYTIDDKTTQYNSNITITGCKIYYCLKRAIKISGEKVIVNKCHCYGTFYGAIIDCQTKDAFISDCDLSNSNLYVGIYIAANAKISNVRIDSCAAAFHVGLLYDSLIQNISISDVVVNYCTSLLNMAGSKEYTIQNFSMDNALVYIHEGSNFIRTGLNVFTDNLLLNNIFCRAFKKDTVVQVELVNPPTNLLKIKGCNNYPFAPVRGERGGNITDVETFPLTKFHLKKTYVANKMVGYADMVVCTLDTFGTLIFNSQKGDMIYNTNPTNGVFALVCTESGDNLSRGTWEEVLL